MLVGTGIPNPAFRRFYEIVRFADSCVSDLFRSEQVLGWRDLDCFPRSARGREESEDGSALAITEKCAELGVEVLRDFRRTGQVFVLFLKKPARCVVEQDALSRADADGLCEMKLNRITVGLEKSGAGRMDEGMHGKVTACGRTRHERPEAACLVAGEF